METSSLPQLRYHNRIDHNNLRYRHSSYSHNHFVQRYVRGRRIHQRLISLTEEILQDMTDTSQSNASISEQHFYNSVPLTTIVREEVLSILEEFVLKEDIDDLIDKCLKNKETIIQERDAKSLASVTNRDGDLPYKESGKNVMLEHRVANLEDLFMCKERESPKLGLMQAKKLKTHTDVIDEDQCVAMNVKIDEEIKCPTKSIAQTTKPSLDEELSIANPTITYDNMYYESREYGLNLLNYKKSLPSVELNKKANLNPYIKPITGVLPEYRLKPKQRSTFIVNNN